MVCVVELLPHVLRLMLLTMVSYGLAWFFQKKTSTKHSKSLPGFHGIPFLGALPYLGKYKEKVLSKWSKMYGPIYQIKLGLSNAVVINSPEIAYEAFAKNDCFNDRLQSIPILLGGNGILLINRNDFHKEQRRFALNTLREFGMGRRSLEPRIIQLSHKLCSKIDALCRNEGVSPYFDMESMFYHLTSSVISCIMFGHEIREEDEELRSVIVILKPKSCTYFLDGMLFLSTFLRHFPVFSYRWKMGLDANKMVKAAIIKEVELHRSTNDPNAPRDFVDCFLNQTENLKKLRMEDEETINLEEKHQKLNNTKEWNHLSTFYEEQLIGIARDLFLAGTDTTANTLLWIVLFLCKYPVIQRKLQTEIDSVFGREGCPKTSMMNETPYVRAVIQEITRLRPVAPIIPHLTAKDGVLSGWKIRKGTLILTNLWEIGTNASRWPEPEKFIPERHIDGGGKFFKHKDWMAFGVGTRSCLGQQLAQMELFITTISLFQKFNFEIGPGHFPDMRGDSSVSLRPFPYKVIASRRQ